MGTPLLIFSLLYQRRCNMRKEESTKTLEDALLNPNNKQNSHIDVSIFFEEHKDSFLSPLTPSK